jgi:hypothetical protein
VKRQSRAFLLVLALAAVPTLTTATPPECPQPLPDAQYPGLPEPLLEEIRQRDALLPSPTPSVTIYGGYIPDVKVGTVAPIGNEIVEPPGCPEISGE